MGDILWNGLDFFGDHDFTALFSARGADEEYENDVRKLFRVDECVTMDDLCSRSEKLEAEGKIDMNVGRGRVSTNLEVMFRNTMEHYEYLSDEDETIYRIVKGALAMTVETPGEVRLMLVGRREGEIITTLHCFILEGGEYIQTFKADFVVK